MKHTKPKPYNLKHEHQEIYISAYTVCKLDVTKTMKTFLSYINEILLHNFNFRSLPKAAEVPEVEILSEGEASLVAFKAYASARVLPMK